MKKLFITIITMLLPMMAMGQLLAEVDFTTATEFTGWTQFDDSQTDGKVELTSEGLAITVGIQTGQLWQPQIMVIPDGSFNLDEDGDYVVVVTAKFPTNGTLQMNMGTWSSNDQDQFAVLSTGDFQEVLCLFENWSVNAEGAHLIFQCGDFRGTTILKKIQIFEYDNSKYEKWSIAGDESLFGANWDLNNNIMMTLDGENYTLTKSNLLLPKGTYYFKVFKDNATDESYPTTKASLVIEEEGYYSIKFAFNINTKEISAKVTKNDVIYYNYIPKGKIAEIKQVSGTFRGDLIIPATVTHEGEEYSITKLGDNAFGGCKYITSVTIPNSVTSIGNNTFQGCSELTSITIPNSVISIGSYAFSDCSKLSSITIPNSVTSIGSYAFSDCSKLSSITIPSSVTSISRCTFTGCTGLSSITIPSSLTSIGSGAFSVCRSLTSITIPNSVTSIGDGTFRFCSGLTSITIPNSVTNIEDYAFSGCSGLTSVTIPNSVTSIGYAAFSSCTGLTSITIPNSVTSIGYEAFSGCTGLTSITIPNSVTNIGGCAFQNCSSLTSITIPNCVTYIGGSAFMGCTGLTSVSIPNSVSVIDGCAFYGCSGLTSLTIGSGVNYIYSQAFANCEKLTDVYCLAEELTSSITRGQAPLSTDLSAFEGSYIEYATLHVPAASFSAYQNIEPWKNFQKIVAIDDSEIPETQKCATPTIKYENGIIKFSCETEGVEFISDITPAEINRKYDSEIVISNTYKVTVYATKPGYKNSDKASIEIQASSGIKGDIDGDGKVNVADHVELTKIIMNE